ncbi:hypothetical protein [Corynebacterium pacaense]|uniref:hypothetical protein n=1 Tax=Corynebacterium pacaense TaxID=1816684 RepID=UPI0009BBB2DA|nr:hypothetical protein [Corynebacterium pacaense]
MRLVVLRCQAPTFTDFSGAPTPPEIHDLPAVPGRRDLRMLDDACFDVLPVDPTPSLDEITRQPEVAHLAQPRPAPQRPGQRLRIVVIGSDAALSAVLTRLMRADNLWAEVGYVPLDPASPAARNWDLPAQTGAALQLALNGGIRPVPVIRDDAAVVVAGSAGITDWEAEEITAEIIIDDHVLLRHAATESTPRHRIVGARLVPMLDAPGIVAVRVEERQRLFGRSRRELPAESLSTGRALQAGGPALRVTVDGISRKRPVERVTFYRHLRDLQMVRGQAD